MNIQKRKRHSAERRMHRVRAKIFGTPSRPRLSVKRTLAHIYAQIIDDVAGQTLAAASDADLRTQNAHDMTKTELASAVGALLAERAKEKKIISVVFDRRDKRYHGRVRALADGARAGGLMF